MTTLGTRRNRDSVIPSRFKTTTSRLAAFRTITLPTLVIFSTTTQRPHNDLTRPSPIFHRSRVTILIPIQAFRELRTRNGWRKRQIHGWEGRTQRKSSTQAEVALCKSRSTGQYKTSHTVHISYLSMVGASSAPRPKPEQNSSLESVGRHESDRVYHAQASMYGHQGRAAAHRSLFARVSNEACRLAFSLSPYLLGLPLLTRRVYETVPVRPCQAFPEE